MLARDLRIYECLGIRPSTFDEALSSAFSGRVNEASKRPHAFVGASDTAEPRVVAIQRLALPSGKSASWALAEYLAFIPRVTGPVVTVKTWQDGRCEFLLKGFREPLLKLRFALDQSSSTRQLFYVSGGMLCGNSTCGRFEFRELPNSDDVLCGVYDFAPRLPWYVYLGTQAWVHRFILEKFQKHVLRRPDGEKPTT
jgi:hypothetical protein